jgi:hypothetical protein
MSDSEVADVQAYLMSIPVPPAEKSIALLNQ